jgi:hypothetical protein
MQTVFDLWTQQRENILEPEPITFRIRSSNAQAISQMQRDYNLSRSQVINDLIGIAISKLPTGKL